MEKFNEIIGLSPYILMVLLIFLQNKFFVTPQELEKKHNEILKEMESRYLPMFSANEMKEQLNEIKSKVDKIYDYFIHN